MAKETELLFEEKQYIGMNRFALLRRIVIAVFCFTAYYWSENPKPVDTLLIDIAEYPGNTSYGRLFFITGLFVLLLSGLLLVVLHMRTILQPGVLTIDGFWSARRVRIELRGIRNVRKVKLQPSLLKRSVYNLHSRNRIRFYTHGVDIIELETMDGITYRIGTQRPDELYRLLQAELEQLTRN